MKIKKWVDMDINELEKESKTFKIVMIITLIVTLIFFSGTMWVYIFIDRVTLMGMFITICFLLLSLFYLICGFIYKY